MALVCLPLTACVSGLFRRGTANAALPEELVSPLFVAFEAPPKRFINEHDADIYSAK